jgi:demethylspheroidene O-methyltransferase
MYIKQNGDTSVKLSTESARAAPATHGETLSDRLKSLRNRVFASARFQTWSSTSLFTRHIARREAQALFGMCAGFVFSQVILAGVRLGLFQILHERPQTLAELAPRLGLTSDAALRLLRAGISLELVEMRSSERYALGQRGAALLGNPAILDMVEHNAMYYADLADPVALLRGEAPPTNISRYWPYAGTTDPSVLSGDKTMPYTSFMGATQRMIAGDILDAYPLTKRVGLLDVGASDGSFLIEAAERSPTLRLMGFDLPAVAAKANSRLAALPIANRAHVTGGDFYTDDLPTGADTVSLVRIMLDHNDDGVVKLLARIHACLPEGGELLIAEPISDAPGTGPIADAYFGFYLLAMGRGRPRSSVEMAKLLNAVGFLKVRMIPTRRPLLTGLLVAQR